MPYTSTLGNIRTDVRFRVVEPTARFFSDTELNLWINKGIQNFASNVKWYSKEFRTGVVANQIDYAFPSDMYKLELVRTQEQYRIRTVDQSTWSQYTLLRSNQSTNIPFFCLAMPHDRFFKLHPTYAASSYQTTVAVGSPIGITDTTITVTSVGQSSSGAGIGNGFLNKGAVIIDNEQIRYYQVNIATNQLLQCVRGWGDTTPATHAANATVTAGDLLLYYRGAPPLLVNDSDIAQVPDMWIEAIALYAESIAWRKRGGSFLPQADVAWKAYMEIRERAASEREAEDMDKSMGVHDEEFGMGFYGDI